MKCPHCLISFHDAWTTWFCSEEKGRREGYKILESYSDCKWLFQAKSTLCPTCGQLIFRVDRSSRSGGSVLESITAYPKGTSRPVPPAVEGKFESDFREACLVIGDSEKASAALSRRCLQNLLREKAETKAKDLASQIQEVLDSGKLPSHLLKGNSFGRFTRINANKRGDIPRGSRTPTRVRQNDSRGFLARAQPAGFLASLDSARWNKTGRLHAFCDSVPASPAGSRAGSPILDTAGLQPCTRVKWLKNYVELLPFCQCAVRHSRTVNVYSSKST